MYLVGCMRAFVVSARGGGMAIFKNILVKTSQDS